MLMTMKFGFAPGADAGAKTTASATVKINQGLIVDLPRNRIPLVPSSENPRS
jgi:hypothetical protein